MISDSKPATLVPELQRRLQALVTPATRSELKRWTNDETRALEVGCGPGQYRLAIPGTYFGIDLTTAAYKEGIPRLVDAVADATLLPFRSAVFDIVFFVGAFNLIVDSRAALAQSLRVLVPGGLLLIFDPSRASLRSLLPHYVKTGTHVEVRQCRDWAPLLRLAGFTGIRVAANSTALVYRLARLLLVNRFYYGCIDNTEGWIVVTAQKPSTSDAIIPAGVEKG